MSNILPGLGKNAIPMPWFPTTMQTFIFRNWHSVDKAVLAEILDTTPENVETEAKRMNLGEQGDTNVWSQKGYITIIRNNWHLLEYDRLLKLLGWSEEKLAQVLKEEDFLGMKLGKKPICQRLKYAPLTKEQIKKTEAAFKTVGRLYSETKEGAVSPFNFWHRESAPKRKKPDKGQIVFDSSWGILNNTNSQTVEKMAERFKAHIEYMWDISLNGSSSLIEISFIENEKDEYHEIEITDDGIFIRGASSAGVLRALYRLEDLSKINGGLFFDKAVYKRLPRFGARFIYSFSALYEAALDVESSFWCPDALLEKYAQTGVNGIWLQAVLSRITPFPFDDSVSLGWERRIKNLKDFADRAESYGIKIYLYINEPRTMPVAFFEKYPDMKGGELGDYACMCLSSAKVQNYLRSSIAHLCKNVPNLGGLFTISMSENATHCKSRPEIGECPHCKNTPVEKLVQLENRLIAEGAYSVNPKIKVIVWNWAWIERLGMNEKACRDALAGMPKNVAVMAKREDHLVHNCGGIENAVIDYSIPVEGISEKSLKIWKAAKEQGCETAAKIQINNSWECSTTPYVPVYKTFISHMNNVIDAGIDHLMLSWTLGGYPSPDVKLISEAFFIENGNKNPDYDKALKAMYGDDFDNVKKATDIFCVAFSEYPHQIDVLYDGPSNGGAANLLYNTPTGYKATMTCYAYDDLESWRGNFPKDVLQQQFKLVADKWETGMPIVKEIGGEIYDISYISYSLFRSAYNQISFVMLREKLLAGENVKADIIKIVKSELEVAENVYKIMRRRSEVGFEAANHYYYSCDNVLEKVLNCEYLLDYYLRL